ncbi:MAG: sigma-54-dependent Fis family transcriptional regulator, partial [Bacteroidia bacterium]|nr:sigma-54-dependent Fis family transcriptional regulator [Bacteroidia bacterium]
MSDRPFLVFVVEDNEYYNKLLVHALSLNPDLLVRSFKNGKDFLAKLSEKPDVITLDYHLPDHKGSTLLQRIQDESPESEVIIISEQEDIETAVDLLKGGAYDYLVKSKDINSRLHNCINNIKKQKDLSTQVKSLQKEVKAKYSFQSSMIGNSKPMKEVFGLIEKAIQTNITVSITGNTGTGKELVAKAIHYNSKLRDKAFVPVNMAAIPKDLVESELFGHE